MEDTWTKRDLPVLQAIVEGYDELGCEFGSEVITARTEFDEGVVQVALRALEHEEPPFVTDMRKSASGHVFLIGAPTGHARRTVGAWPTAESLADRLVAAMDSAAEQEEDAERKGWLKKSAAWLGDAGRGIAVEVAATAINKQAGLQ